MDNDERECALSDLQKKLLDLFTWFHDFCVENKITYYALGGTMLGAARHKGFIPWDDDVDVGIPRADYERLKTIVAQTETGKYMFEFPDSEDELFATPYTKLYDA